MASVLTVLIGWYDDGLTAVLTLKCHHICSSLDSWLLPFPALHFYLCLVLFWPAGFRRFFKLLVQTGSSDRKRKQLFSHVPPALTVETASRVSSSLFFPIYNLLNEKVVPAAAIYVEQRESGCGTTGLSVKLFLPPTPPTQPLSCLWLSSSNFHYSQVR